MGHFERGWYLGGAVVERSGPTPPRNYLFDTAQSHQLCIIRYTQKLFLQGCDLIQKCTISCNQQLKIFIATTTILATPGKSFLKSVFLCPDIWFFNLWTKFSQNSLLGSPFFLENIPLPFFTSPSPHPVWNFNYGYAFLWPLFETFKHYM